MGEKGLASVTPFIRKRLRGAVEGSVSTCAVNVIIVRAEAISVKSGFNDTVASSASNVSLKMVRTYLIVY